MATEQNDRAAAERRAWADDEVKIYRPGDPIPAPPADDDEGDDEE